MLVYTYKPGLHHIHPIITPEQNIQIYRKCIEHNKQFHKVKLYTTIESVELFKDLVSDIEIVDNKIDTFFQDDLKFYVLSKEKGKYTLIDGDIILDRKLEYHNNNGVEFEKLIKNKPNDDYFLKMRNNLTYYNIQGTLKYWQNFDHTYNLGIIRINNNQFVKGFLTEYSKLKDFYKNNIELKNPKLRQSNVIEMATCTYFLSMYLTLNNIPINTLEEINNFTHYSGYIEKLKFLKKYIKVKKPLI